MRTHRAAFGQTADGQPVEIVTLEREGGLRARLMTYGATLVELTAPDRRGRLDDVVLGFDTLAGYEAEPNAYLGCIVGRCANRIAGGEFVLDGRVVRLSINEDPHHLHGGRHGLDRLVWRVLEVTEGHEPGVRLGITSPAGDQGYPGELRAAVTYALTADGLRLDYVASCSAPSPVNLTNHAYFNLAGAGSGTVLEHELWIAAEQTTPTDEGGIPTGAIEPVAGTPLDFRASANARTLGAHIVELAATARGGYDHNFVLRHAEGELALAARLHEPGSGRTMEVLTTEPGLQLYTGNHLSGLTGKQGRTYSRHTALCLEAQRFPDAVHHPAFPDVILRPGETYAQTTVYRFG